MKITPLEIKQQQFEKSLRGYDVADVQAFLTLVSNEYEILLTKNKELEEYIEKLSDRVRHYERVEEALHETLQTTKESVAQKMDNARDEAKNIVDKARNDAEVILKDANHQKANIRQSILRLLEKREEIIEGINSYLQRASSAIDKFSEDEMNIYNVDEETPAPKVTQTEGILEEEETTIDSNVTSRFAFDEEEAEIDNILEENENNSFPPGSDRLDDILDEID